MRAILVMFSVVVLAVLGSAPVASAQGGYGSYSSLSVKEFRNLAESLPELPGRIQALRLFQGTIGQQASVAIATLGEKTGWRLFVFASNSGKHFRLEWKSGKLPYTFAVADPAALRLFDFGNEVGVEFSGCAPHSCGGGPSAVFSVLLYVPSKRTAFMATYSLDKVTYSENLKIKGNERYKGALEQLVKEYADDNGP